MGWRRGEGEKGRTGFEEVEGGCEGGARRRWGGALGGLEGPPLAEVPRAERRLRGAAAAAEGVLERRRAAERHHQARVARALQRRQLLRARLRDRPKRVRPVRGAGESRNIGEEVGADVHHSVVRLDALRLGDHLREAGRVRRAGGRARRPQRRAGRWSERSGTGGATESSSGHESARESAGPARRAEGLHDFRIVHLLGGVRLVVRSLPQQLRGRGERQNTRSAAVLRWIFSPCESAPDAVQEGGSGAVAWQKAAARGERGRHRG